MALIQQIYFTELRTIEPSRYLACIPGINLLVSQTWKRNTIPHLWHHYYSINKNG